MITGSCRGLFAKLSPYLLPQAWAHRSNRRGAAAALDRRRRRCSGELGARWRHKIERGGRDEHDGELTSGEGRRQRPENRGQLRRRRRAWQGGGARALRSSRWRRRAAARQGAGGGLGRAGARGSLYRGAGGRCPGHARPDGSAAAAARLLRPTGPGGPRTGPERIGSGPRARPNLEG
jgi:hypothetical protein